MSSVNIGENFLAGLRTPHYANGRLLTAEDLLADQEAMLARLGFVGEAAGTGIVSGLEVTQVANNLRITAGLGINRNGQAVRLVEAHVELSLAVLPEASAAASGDGRFRTCAQAPAQGGALIESGAYLLVAAPIIQLEGSVSVKTINASTCASRWEVDGVQFKALRLEDAPARTANNAAIYRNLLAHWCFGTETLKTLPRDPFGFPARYSGLDTLGADELTPCDLPLAVFYWENRTLRFVDQWSARRRITHPFPTESWHALIADRRIADAQARFLQFQEQIDAMRRNTAQFSNATLANLYGGAHFRYLPPVGFLPIVPSEALIRSLVTNTLTRIAGAAANLPDNIVTTIVQRVQQRFQTAATFRLEAFFGTKLPRRIGLVDRETVEFRLNRSWYDEPLDFTTLPNVDSRDDETIFEVLLIADELNALIEGLVRLELADRLSDNDITFLGNTFSKLGATLTFNEATGFRNVFGTVVTKRTTALTNVERLTVRSPALTWNRLDLFNEQVLTGFIRQVNLPLQYALFVKTVKATRWIDRDFSER